MVSHILENFGLLTSANKSHSANLSRLPGNNLALLLVFPSLFNLLKQYSSPGDFSHLFMPGSFKSNHRVLAGIMLTLFSNIRKKKQQRRQPFDLPETGTAAHQYKNKKEEILKIFFIAMTAQLLWSNFSPRLVILVLLSFL
jgi:hypothetical protein